MHQDIGEIRQEITEARKQNYWRGFRSALFVTVPIIAALMYETWELLNLVLSH